MVHNGDAIERFESLGYSIPPKTNPSDFFLDTVTIDRRSPELFISSETRIEKFIAAYNAIPQEDSHIEVKEPKKSWCTKTHWSTSWLSEFYTLTDRNLLNDWKKIKERKINTLKSA